MAVDWGQIAQVGMQMAGNYAANRAAGRQQAAAAQQDQNRTAVQQNANQNSVLLQMAQLELLRKQMEEHNRTNRTRQAALGDLIANTRDVSFDAPSHITKFNVSGGLRPSALGPNARQAGGELSSQALAALLEGDSFAPVNPVGPVDLNANMPKESAFDKIMGLAGGVGGAIQGVRAQGQTNASQQQMLDLWSRMVGGGANSNFNNAMQAYAGNGFGIG
jgi:hypothetical protein